MKKANSKWSRGGIGGKKRKLQDKGTWKVIKFWGSLKVKRGMKPPEFDLVSGDQLGGVVKQVPSETMNTGLSEREGGIIRITCSARATTGIRGGGAEEGQKSLKKA